MKPDVDFFMTIDRVNMDWLNMDWADMDWADMDLAVEGRGEVVGEITGDFRKRSSPFVITCPNSTRSASVNVDTSVCICPSVVWVRFRVLGFSWQVMGWLVRGKPWGIMGRGKVAYVGSMATLMGRSR